MYRRVPWKSRVNLSGPSPKRLAPRIPELFSGRVLKSGDEEPTFPTFRLLELGPEILTSNWQGARPYMS